MPSVVLTLPLRRGACLVLLWLLSGSTAFAQVWSLDLSNPQQPLATLDVVALQDMAAGSVFTLQVDDTAQYPIRLEKSEILGNGDRTWYGAIDNTGLDYALVITVGDKTAHLILTSPSGIFQLFGTSDSGDIYVGEFQQLEHVRDVVSVTEFSLPPDEPGNTDVEVGAEAFVIKQTVSQEVALAGTDLTFNLTFTHNGSATLENQYADIFFLLENTTPKQLPQGCERRESTDLMPVLECELGDFAAGQSKQLSYTVSTSLKSHPRIDNTVFVGDTRSDLVVEIYRDVITDTDRDGVSDYNETLLGTDPLVWEHNPDKIAYIDVLVAYTADIGNIYLGEVNTRINQLFSVANKIFADSRTGIKLRPVGIHEVTYQPQPDLLADLDAVASGTNNHFRDIDRLRQLYGGDLVVLFRSGEENGLCGLANLGGKGTQGDLSADYHRAFAFSVINIDCKDDSVLAHEIGHNLGLVHSRREDPDGGTFPYSAGYGVNERFVSVMAFPEDFEFGNRLYRFSDPARACGPFHCGEDKANLIDGADAVSSLDLVKHQVAAYYPGQEDRIGTIKAISNGEPVDATMGIAAYSDAGADFNNTFNVGEAVNLRMKINPTVLQKGQTFVPHVVVMSDKENLYQLTQTGALVPWVLGDFKALQPVFPPRVLGERELFDVARDIDLGSAGLLDKNLFVFIAYRMASTGELIYGASPFTFRVNSTDSLTATMDTLGPH